MFRISFVSSLYIPFLGLWVQGTWIFPAPALFTVLFKSSWIVTKLYARPWENVKVCAADFTLEVSAGHMIDDIVSGKRGKQRRSRIVSTEVLAMIFMVSSPSSTHTHTQCSAFLGSAQQRAHMSLQCGASPEWCEQGKNDERWRKRRKEMGRVLPPATGTSVQALMNHVTPLHLRLVAEQLSVLAYHHFIVTTRTYPQDVATCRA